MGTLPPVGHAEDGAAAVVRDVEGALGAGRHVHRAVAYLPFLEPDLHKVLDSHFVTFHLNETLNPAR